MGCRNLFQIPAIQFAMTAETSALFSPNVTSRPEGWPVGTRSPLPVCALLLAGGLLATSHALGQFTTIVNIPPQHQLSYYQSDTQVNLFDGGQFWFNPAGVVTLPLRNFEINQHGGVFESSTLPSGVTFNAYDGVIGTLTLEDGASAIIFGGQVTRTLTYGQSSIHMMGGWVGANTRIFDQSRFDLFGGSIGDMASVVSGGVLSIYGGSIGDNLAVLEGSQVAISGGSIGRRFDAETGGSVLVSGGVIGELTARSGSSVNISGGLIEQFTADPGASVHLSGGVTTKDFVISRGNNVSFDVDSAYADGELIAGLEEEGAEVTFTPTGPLSGVLADGTPFILPSVFRTIGSGTRAVTLRRVAPLPAPLPVTIVSIDGAPLGARDGQMVVVDGAVAANFAAVGGASVRVVDGGTIGNNFEAQGVDVEVSGGAIGDGFTAVRPLQSKRKGLSC